jgi:hypothetical protein
MIDLHVLLRRKELMSSYVDSLTDQKVLRRKVLVYGIIAVLSFGVVALHFSIFFVILGSVTAVTAIADLVSFTLEARRNANRKRIS